MPELGTSGSVRGDASNGIPYRDKARKRVAPPAFRNIAYTTADHAEHTDQALLQAIGTIYLTIYINLYRGGRC
jgi:hypothetical protein